MVPLVPAGAFAGLWGFGVAAPGCRAASGAPGARQLVGPDVLRRCGPGRRRRSRGRRPGQYRHL